MTQGEKRPYLKLFRARQDDEKPENPIKTFNKPFK
jgi:hypothetical protein